MLPTGFVDSQENLQDPLVELVNIVISHYFNKSGSGAIQAVHAVNPLGCRVRMRTDP